MNKKNNILVLSIIVPLLIALANDYFAKPYSWLDRSSNGISFVSLFVSLIAALIMLFLNKEKKLWVWIFSGVFIIFDAAWLLLGYVITNFGF